MENKTIIIKDDLKVDYTNGRVWIQIGNAGVGFDKDIFIKIISETDSFKEAKELHQSIND